MLLIVFIFILFYLCILYNRKIILILYPVYIFIRHKVLHARNYLVSIKVIHIAGNALTFRHGGSKEQIVVRLQSPAENGYYFGRYVVIDSVPCFSSITETLKLSLFKASGGSGLSINGEYFTNKESERYREVTIPDDF
jgi:hypothetical protein